MAWSLVCPANRGIGYALTRHLLQTTTMPIVATTRRDTQGTSKSLLQDLSSIDPSRLTVLEIDVTDEKSISTAAAEAESLFSGKDSHLRLAFAIPGILHPEKSLNQIDATDALSTFQINTLGPLLLMKHFGDFLPKKGAEIGEESGAPAHAVWTTMSARVGSTTENGLGGWYSYRASKAAVMSLSKTFDLHLQLRSKERAMAIAYHPGTVKTGLSKEFWGGVKKEKLFSTEFAAEKMLGVVNGVGLTGRGKCWDWKGEEIKP